jgi:hypothetical protein
LNAPLLPSVVEIIPPVVELIVSSISKSNVLLDVELHVPPVVKSSYLLNQNESFGDSPNFEQVPIFKLESLEDISQFIKDHQIELDKLFFQNLFINIFNLINMWKI